MSTIVDALAGRVVGTVEAVAPHEITVILELDAPQATALNAVLPVGFPRINGYLLVPSEVGATVGMINEIHVERRPYPKRKGLGDFGLVDLPFPLRLLTLTPLGTLVANDAAEGSDLLLEVRRGIDVFPSVGDPVLLPTPDQLRAIVEGEGSGSARRIQIGRSPVAGGAPVHVDPNKLFGRHLAVLGNTGAGKSCSVAGLIRWSLTAAAKARLEGGRGAQPNARFIILDPNGEYAGAFADLGVRLFQVQPVGEAEQLKVPAWLWNGEEWSAFSGAAPGVQRPLLMQALRMLRAGAGVEENTRTRFAHVVRIYSVGLRATYNAGDHARAFPHFKTPAVLVLGLRDELVECRAGGLVPEELAGDVDAVVETANEYLRSAEFNPNRGRDSYWGPGSHDALLRTVEGLEQVAGVMRLPVESQASEDLPLQFDASQLPGMLESVAALSSSRDLQQFVETLNVRVNGLLRHERLEPVALPDQVPSLVDWLDSYIGSDSAENGAIAVLDLSLLPSDVIHVIVAAVARMTFEAVQRFRRTNAGLELPTVLVLEEAHSFVHKDLSREGGSAAGRMCSQVIERIAREGRKYGLGLVLSSQRPSEVSPTVLSQCNTFLLHRLVNDLDQSLVKRMVPDALSGLLSELPSLPSRRAILLGSAAPSPVLVEMTELSEPQRPRSPDPDFWEVWTGANAAGERRIDWQRVVDDWIGVMDDPDA